MRENAAATTKTKTTTTNGGVGSSSSQRIQARLRQRNNNVSTTGKPCISPVRLLFLALAVVVMAGPLISVLHTNQFYHSSNESNNNSPVWQILSDFAAGGSDSALDVDDGPDVDGVDSPQNDHRKTATRRRRNDDSSSTSISQYRRLQCREYGGPNSEEESQEMVYWKGEIMWLLWLVAVCVCVFI